MPKYLPATLLLIAAFLAGLIAYKNWEEAHAGQERIDVLEHHTRSTDSVYRTDTLYFNRTLRVEVAKRDTVLKHLTDTVLVRQYVGMADSTIRACQSVVLTCEARVAERDSIIAQYRKLKPSRIGVGIGATCGLGIASKVDCVAGISATWAIFH